MPHLEDELKALERLCDRLRSAPESGLVRAQDRLAGRSVADTVHLTAVWAASAQGIDHHVPRLHPLASADQLAVVGGEFLSWAAAEHGRETAVQEWRSQIASLRSAL